MPDILEECSYKPLGRQKNADWSKNRKLLFSVRDNDE